MIAKIQASVLVKLLRRTMAMTITARTIRS
jgi:hypothetical protein